MTIEKIEGTGKTPRDRVEIYQKLMEQLAAEGAGADAAKMVLKGQLSLYFKVDPDVEGIGKSGTNTIKKLTFNSDDADDVHKAKIAELKKMVDPSNPHSMFAGIKIGDRKEKIQFTTEFRNEVGDLKRPVRVQPVHIAALANSAVAAMEAEHELHVHEHEEISLVGLMQALAAALTASGAEKTEEEKEKESQATTAPQSVKTPSKTRIAGQAPLSKYQVNTLKLYALALEALYMSRDSRKKFEESKKENIEHINKLHEITKKQQEKEAATGAEVEEIVNYHEQGKVDASKAKRREALENGKTPPPTYQSKQTG